MKPYLNIDPGKPLPEEVPPDVNDPEVEPDPDDFDDDVKEPPMPESRKRVRIMLGNGQEPPKQHH
jgi:hypothetical protein